MSEEKTLKNLAPISKGQKKLLISIELTVAGILLILFLFTGGCSSSSRNRSSSTGLLYSSDPVYAESTNEQKTKVPLGIIVNEFGDKYFRKPAYGSQFKVDLEENDEVWIKTNNNSFKIAVKGKDCTVVTRDYRKKVIGKYTLSQEGDPQDYPGLVAFVQIIANNGGPSTVIRLK